MSNFIYSYFVFLKVNLLPHFGDHFFKRLYFRLISYKNLNTMSHNHIKLAKFPFHLDPNPKFMQNRLTYFFRRIMHFAVVAMGFRKTKHRKFSYR